MVLNFRNLIATLFVATLLSSCGGGKSEICNCADIALKMITEAKEANGDQEKMKAIQEKYKGDIEKCDKLGEGKSEEEKKKMQEEMKACPSAQEAEKLMKEMQAEAEKRMQEEMQKMQEAMDSSSTTEETKEGK